MPKKMAGTVEPMSIAVCYAFCEYVDSLTRETFVSVQRIAKDLQVSVPTVKRAVAELYKAGWMRPVRKRGRSSVREVAMEPWQFQGITHDPLTGITGDPPSNISYQGQSTEKAIYEPEWAKGT